MPSFVLTNGKVKLSLASSSSQCDPWVEHYSDKYASEAWGWGEEIKSPCKREKRMRCRALWLMVFQGWWRGRRRPPAQENKRREGQTGNMVGKFIPLQLQNQPSTGASVRIRLETLCRPGLRRSRASNRRWQKETKRWVVSTQCNIQMTH